MSSRSGATVPERAPTPDGAPAREVPRDEGRKDLAHTDWEERFPGLVCGITTAFDTDYGLSRGDAGSRLEAYASLGRRLGFGAVAVGRQVHGNRVRTLGSEPTEGLLLAADVDGLTTRHTGWLLAATAADCVPVYLYDPPSGALGLLHAGWRGAAKRILPAGLRALGSLGAGPRSIRVHFGPAICGDCYEVDEPVLRALGIGGDRAHVDLRAVLSHQAREGGVAEGHVSVSSWCTRCSGGWLHSHRGEGATAGRMAAYLGLRDGRSREGGRVREA